MSVRSIQFCPIHKNDLVAVHISVCGVKTHLENARERIPSWTSAARPPALVKRYPRSRAPGKPASPTVNRCWLSFRLTNICLSCIVDVLRLLLRTSTMANMIELPFESRRQVGQARGQWAIRTSPLFNTKRSAFLCFAVVLAVNALFLDDCGLAQAAMPCALAPWGPHPRLQWPTPNSHRVSV